MLSHHTLKIQLVKERHILLYRQEYKKHDKSRLCTLEKLISLLVSPLSQHCKEFSVFLFPERELRGLSQKHEYRNWDCGRAVPVLGIFVSNFRYCVFAVKFTDDLAFRLTINHIYNISENISPEQFDMLHTLATHARFYCKPSRRIKPIR
jgi:hypothetical protein